MTGQTKEDLSQFSKQDLMQRAREMHIEGYSTMDRQELEQAIQRGGGHEHNGAHDRRHADRDHGRDNDNGQRAHHRGDNEDLSKLSKHDLEQRAREMDIHGFSSMNKQELEEAIQRVGGNEHRGRDHNGEHERDHSRHAEHRDHGHDGDHEQRSQHRGDEHDSAHGKKLGDVPGNQTPATPGRKESAHD